MIWQLAKIAADGFLTGMLVGLAMALMFYGVYLGYTIWRDRRAL